MRIRHFGYSHIANLTIQNWADPFVLMRAAFYEDEIGKEMKNRFNSGLSSRGTSCDPNGAQRRDTVPAGHFGLSKKLILFVVYYERDSNPVLAKKQRDAHMRACHTQGETISNLTREFGISPQRVFQIVRSNPNSEED